MDVLDMNSFCEHFDHWIFRGSKTSEDRSDGFGHDEDGGNMRFSDVILRRFPMHFGAESWSTGEQVKI